MSAEIDGDGPQYNRKKFTDNVHGMFGRISNDYDFLNHLLSLNIDKTWRNRLIRSIDIPANGSILDVAAGTGDLTIALAKKYPDATIVASDLTENMLAVCAEKLRKKKLARDTIKLDVGDMLDLPYDDDTFDAVTIAFGIRNVLERGKAISEMRRVVKPGGSVAILELSMPKTPVFKQVYGAYFTRVLPAIGGLISRDRAAYRYLVNSVVSFPRPEAFKTIMERSGLDNVRHISMTFGTAVLFIGTK